MNHKRWLDEPGRLDGRVNGHACFASKVRKSKTFGNQTLIILLVDVNKNDPIFRTVPAGVVYEAGRLYGRENEHKRFFFQGRGHEGRSREAIQEIPHAPAQLFHPHLAQRIDELRTVPAGVVHESDGLDVGWAGEMSITRFFKRAVSTYFSCNNYSTLSPSSVSLKR